jgi:hypothetical protein
MTLHARVSVARIGAPRPRESNAGSVDVGPIEVPRGRHDRWYRSYAHHRASHAADSPREKARKGSQPKSGGPLADGHDAVAARSFLAESSAGRDRRIGTTPCRHPVSGPVEVERGPRPTISGRTCSSVSTRRPFAALERGGNDLVDEQARLGSSRCPLMARRRVFVLFRAGDRVFRSQLLRGLQHRAGTGWFRPLCPQPASPCPALAPQRIDVDSNGGFDIDSALQAPSTSDATPAPTSLRDDGLQTRSAPAVDVQARTR